MVGTSGGRFVEVQGTAEKEPFDEKALRELIAAARGGLRELFLAQRAALQSRLPEDWLSAIQLPSRKSRSVSATRRGSSSIG